MGANIKGAGTDVIRIRGVQKFHKTEYSVIPDQIEAGTFMFAAASDTRRYYGKKCHSEAPGGDESRSFLRSAARWRSLTMRCAWSHPNGSAARMSRRFRIRAIPTDMQPQIGVTLALAKGTSIVTESIFENRFKYMDELARMGASVRVEGNTAIITGVERLTGARVSAPDLRAGAAPVIAALAADGITVVDDIVYIQRGYECFDEKLRSLGAEIEMINSEKEAQKFRLRCG